MSAKHRESGRKIGWLNSEKASAEGRRFLLGRNLLCADGLETIEVKDGSKLAIIGTFAKGNHYVKCGLGKFERLYTLKNSGEVILVSEEMKYKMLTAKHKSDMLKRYGGE